MTTTSSTSSSSSTTSTKASAGSSILTALGAGSGIDTASLVTSLVGAAYSDKESQLQTKTDANTAKISTLATLTSGIDSFASALQQLVAGGTLNSQPSSSNTNILTASAQSGTSLGSLSAQLEVRQIATAQSIASTAFTGGAGTAVGTGSLTLTTAAGSFNVAIDSTNNSLTGLANAINAFNSGTTPSGVTASVITDSSGSRLVLKGATGAANAFTVSANSDASPDLTRFTFTNPATTGSVMGQAQAAQDAIVRIDGVDTTHSSNKITDLIQGVTLNLVSAQVGTTVSLGVTRPTDAISQAVNDFVSAYNTLKGEVQTAVTPASSDGTTAAGPLYGNSAINQMKTMLSKITSTALSSYPSGPQTLAEIGVSTGLDGTLSVDSTKLSAALTNYPDAVEAMFNPTQRSSSPLVAITSAMGSTKPGTYTLTNITTGTHPSGNVDGTAMLPSSTDPNGLVASITSDAPGLAVQVLGNVASVTITIDAGLSGILQGIRDSLRATGGVLDSLSDSLSTEKTNLADAKTKLTTEENNYSSQLTTQFTAMQTAVASYKSIQSYMTQQIAQWSKSS
jgi:flagellar hook-associated protein 2